MIATGGPRGPEPAYKGQERQQTALRIVLPNGKVIFRHYVKGQRKTTDWVKDARAELDPYIRETSRPPRA